jgi:hypothetical protein
MGSRLRVLASGALLVAGMAVAGVEPDWSPGDRVLARWSGDAMLYPARVQKVEGNAVLVAFDDGDVAAVAMRDVRSVTWKAGTRLQCNWKNQGTYYGGIVATMDGESIVFLYDDGDRETMTISRCRENA